MPTDPRPSLIDNAKSEDQWDIIVVGGGATGLATAWDAASRGYRVALLEGSDFASSTSSKSTKLVHGGVRYLQKGDIGLVREALHERFLLLQNAPEFCREQRFILPTHAPLARYYYRLGMTIYDRLAGKNNLKKSCLLSRSDLTKELPNYHKNLPSGGIAYSDGQFDDAALCLAFAQCINACQNGLAVNYLRAHSLVRKNGKVCAVIARDQETGDEWEMKCKVVINATGVFSDLYRSSNQSKITYSVSPSRGSHIVVPGNVMGSNNALIVPKTSDGRVLFAIPWKQHTLIGTTDIPAKHPTHSPTPSQQEIDFLVNEAAQHFPISRADITSTWAGLRPLVSRNKSNATASLSRKHLIDISPDGLISILGGKWTTCRSMAEDTINAAIRTHNLTPVDCKTRNLKLCEHGATPPVDSINSAPSAQLSEQTVSHCVHQLYARNTEDILARRTRVSMLDSKLAEAQSVLLKKALPKYI